MPLTGLHTTLLQGSYLDDRDFLLKVAENNGLRVGTDLSGLLPHFDGFNSIALGYGLDLITTSRSNLRTYFTGVGIPLTAQAETILDQAVATHAQLAVLQRQIQGASGATAQQLQTQISTLQNTLRANVTALTGQGIALTSESHASQLLRLVANDKQSDLTEFLVGNNVVLTDSRERAALVSLWYHTPAYFRNLDSQGNVTSITTLTRALQNDDRAEAWFQIRYGSNGGATASPGIARRRYFEADYFGLYDDGAVASMNDENALGAYRVLTRHKTEIDRYEANYGAEIAATNARYGQTLVQNLEQNLQPARAYLTSHYAYNTNINGDIVVGEHNGQPNATLVGPLFDTTNTLYYRQNTPGADNDILLGSLNNDLIFGESGNDIIYGLGGSDVLYGGAGNDTYYVINGLSLGNNQTRIEDKEGVNTVVLNGVALKFFTKENGDTAFYSPDKRFRAEKQLTDLVVTDTLYGNSVILNEDFQDGDFGIRLVDKPALPPGPTLTGTDNHDTGGSYSSYDTVLGANGMAGGGVLVGATGYAPGYYRTYGYVIGLVIDIPETLMETRLSERGNFSTSYGQLLGLGGDDYIIGNRDAPVYIDGGDGSDWIVGSYFWTSTVSLPVAGELGSTLLGGAGHDALLGTWRDDWIEGGSGNVPTTARRIGTKVPLHDLPYVGSVLLERAA